MGTLTVPIAHEYQLIQIDQQQLKALLLLYGSLHTDLAGFQKNMYDPCSTKLMAHFEPGAPRR